MTDSSYEQRNRELYFSTNGRIGMPLILRDGSTFWSRGESGCEIGCGGDARQDAHLEWFEERRNGVVITGWRCRRV